jgi:hypothetical protein
MHHLRYLEFQRLIKELQFVESDLEYQSEMLKINDVRFLESVNVFLDRYPELKLIYDQRLQKVPDIVLNDVEHTPIVKEEVILNPEIKSLYRNIAKTTHPDKILNDRLNNLYNEATIAYDSGDIITLYKVSSELNIDFEFDDHFIESVRMRIDSIKTQSKMLENTFTYKWLKSNDDESDKIVLDFIRSKIS